MYLIIGLGNPEEEFSKTRHNMGFDVINEIAKNNSIEVNKNKFNALYGMGQINGEKVILLKPQTYMNLSGKAVRRFKDFYKVENENIIVIYDDLDIEQGDIKIKKKGSSGTHNGMKSVVTEINTENFPRIRIGIGNPNYKSDLINYLLNKIPQGEYEILDKSIEKAGKAVEEIIKNGIDKAMNKFN